MSVRRCEFKTMDKPRSHLHTRSYFGEFTAGPLVDWLNSDARRKKFPKGDAIERALELNAGVPFQSTQHNVESYIGRLVAKSKFAVAPVIESVSPCQWTVKWSPVGRLDAMQGLALIKLLQLASDGLLDRVRKCARKGCGLWFYAKFNHMRFDNLACQQQTFRQDPDYKLKRADDQKRARHEAAQRQKRQLEAVTKKGAK